MTDTTQDGAAAIRLVIPAAARYVRVARLAAGGVAADLGFDIESIEDLRVAIDEACTLLLEGCGDAGTEVEVELTYKMDGDTLVIEGRSPCRPGAPVEVHPIARELLDLTSDQYEVGSDDGGRHFRLTKRRRADLE